MVEPELNDEYPRYVRVMLEPRSRYLVTAPRTRYNAVDLIRVEILRGKNASLYLSL